LPRVKIYFYTNHAELAAAVAHVVPNLPDWANALALSEDEIPLSGRKQDLFDVYWIKKYSSKKRKK